MICGFPCVLTSIILFSLSFSVLEPFEAGFVYDTNMAKIDWSAMYNAERPSLPTEDGSYMPNEGQRWMTGLHIDFVKFSRTWRTVGLYNSGHWTQNSFNASGDAVRARTRDGLPMHVSVKFQYKLVTEPEEDGAVNLKLKRLFELYCSEPQCMEQSEGFGLDQKPMWEPYFARYASNVIRDVVSDHSIRDFFEKRETVGANIQTAMSTYFRKHCASDIKGLQVLSFDITVGKSKAVQDSLETTAVAHQAIATENFTKLATEVIADTAVKTSNISTLLLTIAADADAQETLLSAEAEASATHLSVGAERDAYERLKSTLGLNNAQLMSFVWLQIMENRQKPESSAPTIFAVGKPLP